MTQEKFFAYLVCTITYGLLLLCSLIVLVRTYLYGLTILKRFVIGHSDSGDSFDSNSSIVGDSSQYSSSDENKSQEEQNGKMYASINSEENVQKSFEQQEEESMPIMNQYLLNKKTSHNIAYETESSFSDKKLIMFLIMSASVVRFVQFLLQTFVKHFRVYRSMEILVSTLPATIFVSIELLLVFFWAEIVHKSRSEGLKLLFIALNVLIYLILIVFDSLLVYQFFNIDRQLYNISDSFKIQNNKYSKFEILSVSYSAFLFLLAALGIALYGSLIIRNLNRMLTSDSNLVRKTIRIVFLVSSISIFCLIGRAVVIIVQIFVLDMETKWYTIVTYYLCGEMIPLSLLIYILNLMTSQQRITISRLYNQQHRKKMETRKPVFIHQPSAHNIFRNHSSLDYYPKYHSYNQVLNDKGNNGTMIPISTQRPANNIDTNRRPFSANMRACHSLLRYSPQSHQISGTYNVDDSISGQLPKDQATNAKKKNSDIAHVVHLKRTDSQSSIQTCTESDYDVMDSDNEL